MTSQDTLESLKDKSSCPVCGCIEQKGSIRCSECGTFHSGIHLEEREPPPKNSIPEREISDPTLYSMSNQHSIPEEDFEESETISTWDGGSTDFTMSDEEEKPLAKIDPDELELPVPEILSDDL